MIPSIPCKYGYAEFPLLLFIQLKLSIILTLEALREVERAVGHRGKDG